MADNTIASQSVAQSVPVVSQERIVSDEVSVITEGTVIKGDIVSNGSLDVKGQVNGNVSCNGKLTVTGVVNGNSNTSEFFADAAQIEGEVVSSGTVKIGLGSVIIGNLTSTSAVIAGAIKGDIDVQGPVVVDTSAVVMGNIKSRSVQINNGAVIEGFCSQCYSDVDVQSLFESKKGTMN
jgi:cytoskeletal protein CcmA (bactofilin family)